MTDDRLAIILVDYPTQTRLKILGRAEILEGEAAKAVDRARTRSRIQSAGGNGYS